MSWGLQQRDFPILTPGQMNPFHQALASGLDTYKNMVTAGYEPQRLASNIAAKNAYAQNIGRQSIATILGNPMAVANMDDSQFKGMLAQVGNPMNNSNTAASQEPSSGIGAIFDHIKKSLGIGQNSDDSASGSNQGSNTPSQTTSSNAYDYDDKGNNVVASPSEVADVAQNGNQATPPAPNNQAAELKDAYIAKNFPGSPQGIAATGRIKSAEKSANVESAAYQTNKTQTNASSLGAQKALTDLDDFHQSYQQAVIKGPFTKIPIISALAQLDPSYQQAANDSNNLVLDLAPTLLAGGKQTDYGRQLIKNAKIDPTLSPSAEKHVFNKQKLILSRISEQAPFNDELEKYGIKDVNQQQSDFLAYNLKHKLIDSNGNFLPQNLDKYKQFIANKYGKSYSAAKNPVNESSVEGKEPPAGTVWMMTSEGYKVPVHKSRKADAYKRGLTEIE